MVIQAVGELAGIGIDPNTYIHVAEARLGWIAAQQIGRIAVLRKLVVVRVPLGIERPKEEEVVLETRHVPAKFRVHIILPLVQDPAVQVEPLLQRTCTKVIRLQALPFELLWPEEARNLTMEGVAA